VTGPARPASTALSPGDLGSFLHAMASSIALVRGWGWFLEGGLSSSAFLLGTSSSSEDLPSA